MKLSAPTQILFLISLVLAVLALLGHFTVVPTLAQYQFWFAIAAYAVLVVGCLMKGK